MGTAIEERERLNLKKVSEYKYYINLSPDKPITDSTFLIELSRILNASYLSDEFKEIAQIAERTFWLKGIEQRKRRALLGVYKGYMKSHSEEAALKEIYGNMQKKVDNVLVSWDHKKDYQKVQMLSDLIHEAAGKGYKIATTRFVYILNELQLKKRDIFKNVVLTINYEDIN